MGSIMVSFKSSGGTFDWSNWTAEQNPPYGLAFLTNGIPTMEIPVGYTSIGAGLAFQIGTTFEALGIPAGSTVTGISGASCQSKCTAFGHKVLGNVSVAAPATLADGGTTFQLAAQRQIAGVDSSFVTTSGAGASGLSLPSSDSITLTIAASLINGAHASDSIALEQDSLVFTIDYQ